MIFRSLVAAVLSLVAFSAGAQTNWPAQQEGDFIIKDFRFNSGESLPELRLHYMTIGTPKRNAAGDVANAVMLLHGTSGSGKSWLLPSLSNELFGKDQPLDVSAYFIVIPDAIGVGGSSKPSDGLRGIFPHYRYRDIVEAEHRLVTEGLGLRHLRLVMGSSMGGMQTWMWGEAQPDFMDALMPLASLPWPITRRNYVWRRMLSDVIREDPEWRDGEYRTEPRGLKMAQYLLTVMGSTAIDWQ